MAKPTTDRITNIDEKIKQLQQQKKAILAREKEKERKARTRRLIQKGAIVEKYLPDIPDDMLAHGLDLVRIFFVAEEQLRGGQQLTKKDVESLVFKLNSLTSSTQR